MRLLIIAVAAAIAFARFYGITHPAYQAAAHGMVFSMFALAIWTYKYPTNHFCYRDPIAFMMDDWHFFTMIGSVLTAVEIYCAWPLIVGGFEKLQARFF